MNHFNKEISLKKKKLETPMYVQLIYDPKINIHIDKSSGFFLSTVDTAYVMNFRTNLIKELEKVNIIVTSEAAPASLSIDEILLIEKNVEGSDSDNQSTIEVDVCLYMSGYLDQRLSSQKQRIEALIGNTTTTGMSLFSVLFGSSDYDIQKNDTYEEGVAEKNLLTLFAKECVEKIR